MIEVQCTRCRIWQPQDCFTRDSTCSSGRRSECKTCRQAYKRKWTQMRRGPIKERDARTTELQRERTAWELVSKARAWVYDTQPAQLRATIGGGYV